MTEQLAKPDQWMITRLMFRQMKPGMLGGIFNLTAYAVIAFFSIPWPYITTWYVTLLATYIVRGIFIYKMVKMDDWSIVSEAEIRRRKKVFDIGIAANGLLWGMPAYFLTPDQSFAFHFVTTLIIAGMAAGTIVSLSYSARTLALMVVPAVLPMCIHFLLGGTPDYYAAAFMTFVYLIFLLAAGRTIRHQAMAALQLKMERDSISAERDSQEAANKAKSIFLARVSHEIRTPLAAVTGFADLVLGQQTLSSQTRADLEVIARNSRHLTSLVNDLLDLSKIQSGKIPIEKCWMSPIELISDAMQVVRSAAESKHLNLAVRYARNIPERIYSDPNRFHQIVLNLLTNAIKFTQKGGIHIDVLFDTHLRVRVSDTGIGVAPQLREKIFEPFVRGEGPSEQPGSGLGLALSSDLARCLGGELKLVKTDLGRGSIFELSIEPGQPVDELSGAVDSATDEFSTQRILRNKRILVVEDDPDLQELIRRQMFQVGAKVDTCANGAECVDRFSRDAYDVVLMDIQMPVMTGDVAAKRLRRLGFEGPIIAVTAHGSEADHRLALESGCTDYLSKPFELSVLVQAVVRTLRVHSPAVSS